MSPYGVVIANGVRGGAVNDMHEHLTALCVAQKLMPQADSSMRSLQQPCSTISSLHCTFSFLGSPSDHDIHAKLPLCMSQEGAPGNGLMCQEGQYGRQHVAT
jgi:hypothetical protein